MHTMLAVVMSCTQSSAKTWGQNQGHKPTVSLALSYDNGPSSLPPLPP